MTCTFATSSINNQIVVIIIIIFDVMPEAAIAEPEETSIARQDLVHAVVTCRVRRLMEGF
jgi:hypothetical protein